VISLLDRLLLTLMIVELLYPVQVSFREHTLVPEPFLLVGLVAATRRHPGPHRGAGRREGPAPGGLPLVDDSSSAVFAVMIVAFVACLLMLRRRGTTADAKPGLSR
jgi:hypothetical protein